METFEFGHPEAFWGFALIPLLLAYSLWSSRKRQPRIKANATSGSTTGWKSTFRFTPLALRYLALCLGIVALAEPRNRQERVQTSGTEGIDIVLAVDVSTSMLARDLKPNRLEALKEVAANFAEGRPTDRLGLVVYSGEAFTQVPLTTDRGILQNALNSLKSGMLQDGTAIGLGLATAVNRLKESEAKSKVIILLTDGENNSGFIDPKTAAELAKEFGIKTYTIGVGTRGVAPTPVAIDFGGNLIYQDRPVSIDEDLLKWIAQETGGQYFRATSNSALQDVYAEIDQLERSEISSFQFYTFTALFRPWVLAALGLILLERLLALTLFKSVVA